MVKKFIAFIVVFTLFSLINPTKIDAAKGLSDTCDLTDSLFNHDCQNDLYCKLLAPGSNFGSCEELIDEGDPCDPEDDAPTHGCKNKLFCKPLVARPDMGTCEEDSIRNVFGKITPPDPIAPFLFKNPTGSGAISEFLSRLIVLIYSIAGIVLIFMLLWGAFDWMTSGGDKEKIASAQRRIINAVIGIILFAVAFAVIRILGIFTGFTFFRG